MEETKQGSLSVALKSDSIEEVGLADYRVPRLLTPAARGRLAVQ